MKQDRALMRPAFLMAVLVILVSLVAVGTVAAADYDMMDTCRQLAAGNGTTGYGPGMMSAGSAQMMESVEVNAMGGPMHDEMQGLVTKMMAGSLSSTDQARMVEIMNKYPGASNMMMTRMMGGNGQGWSGYPGMMGTNGQYYGMMGTNGVYSCASMMGGAGMMDAGLMTGGSILIVLFFVVWLIVGILLIIWLIKQLQTDKKQP
jgi:hypothetical protein